MNLIDKDAVVAEIRKQMKIELGYGYTTEQRVVADAGKNLALRNLLFFLDTLEVKEVDLELTLEDVSIIRQIIFDYNRQVRNEMSIPNDKEYCQEVLKRFKAQKGE